MSQINKMLFQERKHIEKSDALERSGSFYITFIATFNSRVW